ncbi:hypothetical protein K491DRAFT_708384 [Lophiostoma macrostomum CBS 122681]|uniref:Rhodopsin domain-containing protein n=1 Tax=Lophiostoma macrostomum CBS 122681 TaxID=1314788 RepID=A0A6A6SNE5_9PLEO|nr:hypothetical protein K491DRAFT_708384 [Lophiostoma macrostomum CBS 122681]
MSPTRTPSIINHQLVVVSVIFPLIALVTVSLRFRARAAAKQPLRADDWWILASWISTLGMSINVWVFAHIIGVDYVKDPIPGAMYSRMAIWISGRMIQFPLATVKIGILLFYMRIFSTPRFKLWAWIAIVVTACWGIVLFFLGLVLADPIDAAWNPTRGHLRFNPGTFSIAQTSTSLALDVFVLCFPVPKIMRLHLDLKRKISIVMIFWLGSFCAIAAIVRLALIQQSTSKVLKSQGSSLVALQWKVYLFMLLEANCSVIAACLPCYGPLLRGFGVRAPESILRSVRSVFSLRSRNSSGNRSNHNQSGATSGLHKGGTATDSQIELNGSLSAQQQGNSKKTFSGW